MVDGSEQTGEYAVERLTPSDDVYSERTPIKLGCEEKPYLSSSIFNYGVPRVQCAIDAVVCIGEQEVRLSLTRR